MSSMATTRGAACPRRVSVDMTDKIVKMFLWARHDKHTALLAVLWTGSTGLGFAAARGHESSPIRWAWVSDDPAGLSQRRSGGHWVRGGPVAWYPANGAPGGAATRELGNLPADISRDRRAWGLVASGLAALAAIPPNSHADLQWAMAGITSGDFHAAGQTQNTGTNKNFSKN